MSNQKPVAIVTGVGPGTGAAVVRRFARGGYAVAMLARRRERLAQLEQEIAGAHAYPCEPHQPRMKDRGGARQVGASAQTG